jgi:hypothetical protein
VTLDSALWLASDVAQAALIGLLIHRHLWRKFPVFFVYIAAALVGDVGAAIIVHKYSIYNPVYSKWYLAETIAGSILMFGVLVELAWSILKPVRASLSRRALIPVVGVILAVGAAVWPFAALPGLAGASGPNHILVQLQQTVSILQVIFLLALIGFSQFLSISWRDRELQIATGLGFFSFISIGVAMLAIHQSSWLQYRHLYPVEIGAFICCFLYWIVSFAQQEAERRQFTPQMQSFLLAVAGAARSTRIGLSEPGSDKQQKPDR